MQLLVLGGEKHVTVVSIEAVVGVVKLVLRHAEELIDGYCTIWTKVDSAYRGLQT